MKLISLLMTLVLCACSGNGGGSSKTAGNNQGQGGGSNQQQPAPGSVTDDQNNAPKPDPQIDPATVQAIPARTWESAKYAFCSAQGRYGVFIDFQNTNLATAQSGKYKFAVRSCHSSQPFQWKEASNFTVKTNAQGIRTFDFGYVLSPPNCYGCSNDTIEISGPHSEGYGSMGGNSGPCRFLENAATGGLFNQDPFFSCQ